MSSYFVNSLATCYNQGVGDGGGPETRDSYPQSGSPYRGYGGTPAYPYAAQSPGVGQNGDYYLTQRLSHPPLRETSSPVVSREIPLPVPKSQPPVAVTPTPTSGYTNTGSYNTTNNSVAVNSTSANNNSADLSPIDSPRPAPTTTTTTNISSASPGSGPGSPDSPGSGAPSSQQSASSSPPGQTKPAVNNNTPQIYPWMRRMHVGHGNSHDERGRALQSPSNVPSHSSELNSFFISLLCQLGNLASVLLLP